MLSATLKKSLPGKSFFTEEAKHLLLSCTSLWGSQAMAPGFFSDSSKTRSREVSEIWQKLENLAAKGHALKESDTVCSIFYLLLNNGFNPPTLDSWCFFVRYLMPFTNVEYQSVLQYPGESSIFSLATETIPSSRIEPYTYLHPSRETLLLTGGVVPLSARRPCSDGFTLSYFLNAICSDIREKFFDNDTVDLQKALTERLNQKNPEEICASLQIILICTLQALEKNQFSIPLKRVQKAFATLLHLHLHFSFCGLAQQRSSTLLCQTSHEKSIQTFVAHIEDVFSSFNSVTGQGLGPLISLHFFASFSMEEWTGEHYFSWKDCTDCHKWLAVRITVLLERLMSTLHCIKVVDDQANDNLTPLLRHLEGTLDRVFQHNANHGNLLQITPETEKNYRRQLMELLLMCMRQEALSPEQFLRDAMDVVDRSAPSMTIEAELLYAKVQLLEVFPLDDDGRETVYKDLIASLRNLVELRPRVNSMEDDVESGAVDKSMDDLLDTHSLRLDAESQHIMQRAHEEVIRVLSASANEAFLNEAYGIIISHKYHGLTVTKEVIKPLLLALAARGDGRAFNLVDLCVLYSNKTLDMDVLSALFRTCAVNGDFYRARTLLHLLEDIIPGFLLKASSGVLESLRSLKLLPNRPRHLFVSEEDYQDASAFGSAPSPLREIN